MPSEPSVALYQLVSSDGQSFLVDRDTLRMIGRVENLFESAGLDLIPHDQLHPISLEIPGNVMSKMIEWCDHHKKNPPYNENEEISQWDASFFIVSHSFLFELIRAARNFDVPGLFAMCCQVVQQNPDEIIAGILQAPDENEVNPERERYNRGIAAAAA